MKLEISTTNQTGMNRDYVLVVDDGLVLRIKTSERSSGRREGPEKTDGRQTFPQQGSSGFYWQRQNLVQKVLSGASGARHARPGPGLQDESQSCPLENSCRLHFWCQWSPDVTLRHSLCYCNQIFSDLLNILICRLNFSPGLGRDTSRPALSSPSTHAVLQQHSQATTRRLHANFGSSLFVTADMFHLEMFTGTSSEYHDCILHLQHTSDCVISNWACRRVNTIEILGNT